MLIEHDLLRLVVDLKDSSYDRSALKEYMSKLPHKNISPAPTATSVPSSPTLNSPMVKAKQENLETEGFCYVFHNEAQKEIIISVCNHTWRYSDNIPLKNFLSDLPEPGKLYTDSTTQVYMNGNTKLELAFLPERILCIGSHLYPVSFKIQFKGIENWLRSIDLSHLIAVFRRNFIDDFLVLPFLRESDLDEMDIKGNDKNKILHSVRDIRNGGNAQCKGEMKFSLFLIEV